MLFWYFKFYGVLWDGYYYNGYMHNFIEEYGIKKV